MNILKSFAIILALLLSSGTAYAGKVGSGSFPGSSQYNISGNVKVTKSGDKITITLGKGYKMGAAPDPYVSLGKGSQPVSGGIIRLLTKQGGQSITFSAKNIDLAKVDSVIIWCKRYSVPLAVAKIK